MGVSLDGKLSESFDVLVTQDLRLRRAVSELRAEHTTQRTLFCLMLPGDERVELERGDVHSLLVVMFARHALYKGRLALLNAIRRKYLDK